MDENEITQRLRDAGDQPVPGEVRASHLSQMHAATPTIERPKRFGRLAVAAAAFVGFAVGSTGFAMAGALPDPAQQVAHDVLAVVQIDVENPKANRGQCVSQIAKQDMPEDEKARLKAACHKGKPDHAGEGKGRGRPAEAGVPGGPSGPPHADDECKGPPPWAGKQSPEAKDAAKADRPACRELDDDPAEAQAEALEDQQEREAEALEEQQEREAEPAPEQPEAGAQGDVPEETPPPAPPVEDAPEQPADEVPPAEAETDEITDPDGG